MPTPSPTARRLLVLTRLRARRLALWIEHMWQTGQTSPDQGPAIGSAEVARLLAPDTMRDAEAAFYAESAAELSEQAAKAAAELARDPGWIVIRHASASRRTKASCWGCCSRSKWTPGLAA